MKKIILFLLFTMPVALYAQQIAFGLKAGVNFANVNIKESGFSLSPDAQTAFHLTGFSDFAISETFSVQPGISFQGKGYKYASDGEKLSSNVGYLEIPVNAVYYVPAGSGKIFLGAGPYVALGLFGKGKYDGSLGSESNDLSFGNDADDNYSKEDFGFNFMAGYHLENGLLFNVNYGLGITNNLPKVYREESSRKHKVFSISVGFAI